MTDFNDYTRTTTAYIEAWDKQLWKISNPSPDASVPNFTAHHPEGHIIGAVYMSELERKINAFNKAQA